MPVKGLIIAASAIAILASASATAHVPERCASHGESFEAAWTETHAVIRETFLFMLKPADQPADPTPKLLELVEKTEAAREAELDALATWFECVGGDG